MSQNILQFSTMENITDLSGSSILWPEQGKGLRYFINNNRVLTADGGHPNEKGHQYISEILRAEIDKQTV